MFRLLEPLRTTLLLTGFCLFAVLAVTQTATAVSPYDTAYGIQWNFQTGSDGPDNPVAVAASPDGSAWVAEGHNGGNPDPGPWGGDNNGGSWDSGYGQISAQGSILQGSELPNITGYVNDNQSYIRGSLSMQGTTAYLAWGATGNAYWASEGSTTAYPRSFMTYSIAPDGTEGRMMKAPLQDPGSGNRVQGSVVSATSTDMWHVGGYQWDNGFCDTFTAGDGSLPVGSPSYSPFIGKTTEAGVLSGPVKQGNTDGRSYFDDISVNETTGMIVASGFTYAGSGGDPTYWDVDGDGTADHNFAVTTDHARGLAAVYDSSFNVVASTVWESNYGGDWIYDNEITPDGGFVLAGRTKGSMPGKTNPAEGTYDVYVAKYDSAGAMVWDYQSQTTNEDEANSVSVDLDGNIYVGIESNSTDDDAVLMKMQSDGTVVWTSTIDNADSADTQIDHDNVDKNKIYVLSENNPSVGGVWTGSTAYTPQGTDEILLQKMTPGDFDTDGDVDWTDMRTVMAAVAGGPLVGDDTYDFDEDGDSDTDDVGFFMENIFDSDFGDFDWDGVKGDQDDYDLLMGWEPGDAPIALPATWKGFSGPTTPALVDLEEWQYLNDLGVGAIPEPSTLVLTALGLLGLGLGGWRRRRQAG